MKKLFSLLFSFLFLFNAGFISNAAEVDLKKITLYTNQQEASVSNDVSKSVTQKKKYTTILSKIFYGFKEVFYGVDKIIVRGVISGIKAAALEQLLLMPNEIATNDVKTAICNSAENFTKSIANFTKPFSKDYLFSKVGLFWGLLSKFMELYVYGYQNAPI